MGFVLLVEGYQGGHFVVMVVPGCKDCTWLYKDVLGRTLLYKAVHSCTWLYKVVYGCTSLYIVVKGCICLNKIIHA